MIPANELRIGNLVNTKDFTFCPVLTIAKSSIRIAIDSVLEDIFCHNEELQPIPITPEILKNCGFNPFFHNFEKSIKINYSVVDNRAYVGNSTSTSGTSVINIKYLHQLQNLIHALTGEELTIKNPS